MLVYWEPFNQFALMDKAVPYCLFDKFYAHAPFKFLVHRRRAEFGMLEDPTLELSDSDLLTFVNEEHCRNPCVGESLVTGSLRSHGYHIQEKEFVMLFVLQVHYGNGQEG